MINNHKNKKEFKMINNHKMIKREKGVTLLEVLAVVIIGILIVVGAFTLYGSGQDKQKRENDVMTSLLTLQTNVRDSFYGVNDYGTAAELNSVIIASGGAPSTFVQGTASAGDRELVSPFDTTQPVTITGEGSEFEIAISGVPESSCVSLATRRGSFLRVEIDGTEITSPLLASKNCDADGDNTVTYVSN